MHTSSQKSNYSFETSLPAYKSNPTVKAKQKSHTLSIFNELGGRATLKQVADKMGLPQSTVSGRINDLIEDKELIDTGQKEMYDGLVRKVFAIVSKASTNMINPIQKPLFDYKKIVQ